MNPITDRRRDAHRRFTAVTILTVGLGSALVIYLTAGPAPPNPLGYDPQDSRQYLRQMEVYGGRANLLASGFREWFESLWHGRRLAVTIIFLTFVLLLFYLVASTPLPPGERASPLDEKEPGRPGS